MFGISRQAYYKRIHKSFDEEQKQAQVINLVKPLRLEQSRLGTLKVYKLIKCKTLGNIFRIDYNIYFHSQYYKKTQ